MGIRESGSQGQESEKSFFKLIYKHVMMQIFLANSLLDICLSTLQWYFSVGHVMKLLILQFKVWIFGLSGCDLKLIIPKKRNPWMKLSAFRRTRNSLSRQKPWARNTEGNVKEKQVFLKNTADRHVCYFPLSLILHISQRASRQEIWHCSVLRGWWVTAQR